MTTVQRMTVNKTHTVMVLRPDGSARMIPARGLLDGNDVLPGFTVEWASIVA